jgi:Na+-transporting NADH:ubiquinone oxidoreductase subunit C
VHSNRYTLLYALSLTVAVAVTLALASTGLAPRQEANAERARQVAILESVMDVDPETVETDFDAYITARVFDVDGNERSDVDASDLDIVREARKPPEERLFPVYEFSFENRRHFIVPLRGAGLWGPISAYLALDSDLNTIVGVSFDHEKETPGLGAEITTPDFESRFVGKTMLDESGNFTSIRIVKSGQSDSGPHAVDGLTGATMTMNGVTNMLRDDLGLYRTVFEGADL